MKRAAALTLERRAVNSSSNEKGRALRGPSASLELFRYAQGFVVAVGTTVVVAAGVDVSVAVAVSVAVPVFVAVAVAHTLTLWPALGSGAIGTPPSRPSNQKSPLFTMVLSEGTGRVTE